MNQVQAQTEPRQEIPVSYKLTPGFGVAKIKRRNLSINECSKSFSGLSAKKNLQLTRAEMQTLGYQVIDMLVEHFESVPNKPVTRKASRAELENRLNQPIPQSGTDPANILQQLQQDVFSNIAHPDHPRYFAFVPGPSNFVSVMADTLASGFNAFAGAWLVGSGPSEIELLTIDWLRQIFKLPDTAGGIFVSGGSIANLTALTTARQIKLNNKIENATVYFSEQTHSSILRALKILGFKPDQIRKLPTDDNFRLSLPHLQQAVIADRAAGKQPFCVVANAGTTNSGAIDPLSELADFCQQEELWLHVDGAYGAAAILSEQGRFLLKGLERVDSLTIDPHKWLFQPYEIGCVLVRDNSWLKETFACQAEYLKDVNRQEEEVNFYNYGIQLTRSFRSLKLWMSLKTFGVEAFREAISWGIGLAELTESLLQNLPDWEVITSAQIGVLTFRYAPAGRSCEYINAINQKIVDDTATEGFALVNTTILKERKVIRMCTINPRTTVEDIRETISRLNKLAKLIDKNYSQQK
ncbi:pyridoxal phosphate-dependent decarboxylase family protein [Cylindrospermum sp. FACHB-282]|uniref:pyridoxal phosphate-dependent decarboxylase family protein n=1 Tax=Cylindrospermum sp. FACHB-282 TaxID=2692794 RepID=UPI0018EFF36A|nr:aminotransferase class I/II-fold pyridoxal phosphate-dependent enzyme [Cylindrospermum sp. FACHB-282]